MLMLSRAAAQIPFATNLGAWVRRACAMRTRPARRDCAPRLAIIDLREVGDCHFLIRNPGLTLPAVPSSAGIQCSYIGFRQSGESQLLSQDWMRSVKREWEGAQLTDWGLGDHNGERRCKCLHGDRHQTERGKSPYQEQSSTRMQPAASAGDEVSRSKHEG